MRDWQTSLPDDGLGESAARLTPHMAANRKNFRLFLAALAAASFAVAAPAAHGALTSPVLLGPAAGVSVQTLPAFSWSPVPGAESYEFQVAADQGFNSPVLGRGEGSFATRNTRATLKKTLPNGRYWWRVRATNKDGAASPWAGPRSLVKSWRLVPATQAPVSGFPFTFPVNPISVGWTPVPYAASYMFSLASDPALANIVQNSGQPVETWGTNYVPSFTLLPSGTYYWNVVPVDSEGNLGAASPVSSFSYSWPSVTSPAVTDLVAATEFFDPQFSWTAVQGATKYEVEVNSSSDFAPGSKVCCTQLTTSTSLAPTVVFRDNTYYWRVRAVDAAGNAGVWNLGSELRQDVRQGAAGDSAEHQEPPDARQPRRPGHGRSTRHRGLSDQRPDPQVGHRARRLELHRRRRASSTGLAATAAATRLARDDLGSLLDPARLGLERRTSRTRMGCRSPTTPPSSCSTSSTALVCGPGGARRGAPGGLRRFHVHSTPAEAAGPSSGPAIPPAAPALRLATPATRARTTTSCRPAERSRGLTPLITWKPLVRAPELLRDRLEGRKLQQHRRLRLHAGPGLFAAQLRRPTTYSDETTLFYWAVLPATNFNGSSAVERPARGGRVELPEAVDPARGDLAGEWRAAHGPARLPLDAGRGCAPLPLPGCAGTDVRGPARGRHDRSDLVHALHDPSCRYDPLLACPRGRREPDRAQLVAGAHVPAPAADADAVCRQPRRVATSRPPGNGRT